MSFWFPSKIIFIQHYVGNQYSLEAVTELLSKSFLLFSLRNINLRRRGMLSHTAGCDRLAQRLRRFTLSITACNRHYRAAQTFTLARDY